MPLDSAAGQSDMAAPGPAVQPSADGSGARSGRTAGRSRSTARPDQGPAHRSRVPPGPARVDSTSPRSAANRFRGRAPYGYRTVVEEGGGDTRTLRRLVPDEQTAPVVRRIFQRYLEGGGLQGIAEELTAEAIPCPSAHDKVRNPHHGGVAWSKAAVRSILVNARYTGRLDGSASEVVVHPPLADSDQFVQVQQTIRAKRQAPESTGARPPYLFRGMLRCGVCGRLMQGTWNNGAPYYRCRFPGEYAAANGIAHPRNVYLRERRLVRPLDAWLTSTLPPALTQAVRAGCDPAAPARLARAAQTLARLPDADPEERLRFYGWLGMRLTYSGSDPLVWVKVYLGQRPVIRGEVPL